LVQGDLILINDDVRGFQRCYLFPGRRRLRAVPRYALTKLIGYV
jgi:hypothetical protein